MDAKRQLVDEVFGLLRKVERTGRMETLNRATGQRETQEVKLLSDAVTALLGDPDYDRVDWIEVAIRRVGGVGKAAAVVGSNEQTIQNYRKAHWAPFRLRDLNKLAEKSGIPLGALILPFLHGQEPKAKSKKK